MDCDGSQKLEDICPDINACRERILSDDVSRYDQRMYTMYEKRFDEFTERLGLVFAKDVFLAKDINDANRGKEFYDVEGWRGGAPVLRKCMWVQGEMGLFGFRKWSDRRAEKAREISTAGLGGSETALPLESSGTESFDPSSTRGRASILDVLSSHTKRLIVQCNAFLSFDRYLSVIDREREPDYPQYRHRSLVPVSLWEMLRIPSPPASPPPPPLPPSPPSPPPPPPPPRSIIASLFGGR